MNKLQMKQDEILEVKEKDSIIEIREDRNIYELHLPKKKFHSTWNIKENTTLKMECIIILKNTTGIITIKSSENTKCSIKLGIKAIGENNLTIENIIEGNSNESTIEVKIVGEENSETIITTTGYLKENTIGNVFNEKVKYLNEEQSIIHCIPNLFVNSNEAIANHSATIAKISKEDLFYLESKGMTEIEARKLIRACFLKQKNRKEDTYEY